MKILFIAVFDPISTNVSQSKGFKENGHEVIEYDYRKKLIEFNSVEKRDDDIINLVKTIKPNLVLFSKCNDIDVRVVDECNKVSKTFLWYMDPVNNEFSLSLIQKIKKCNLVFCALWDSFEKCKIYGGNKVHFLQEGFDHIQNYPIETEKYYDVSFIGGLRNKRFEYHQHLNFTVIDDAYGEKHSLMVSKSKINLNFTEGGTSDRTYKVLASKGFLLTEPWPNMEKDFTIGKDLDIFTNVTELKEKINYYLSNDEERLKIAENGYKTVQKFSRINWAKEILKKYYENNNQLWFI